MLRYHQSRPRLIRLRIIGHATIRAGDCRSSRLVGDKERAVAGCKRREQIWPDFLSGLRTTAKGSRTVPDPCQYGRSGCRCSGCPVVSSGPLFRFADMIMGASESEIAIDVTLNGRLLMAQENSLSISYAHSTIFSVALDSRSLGLLQALNRHATLSWKQDDN